MSTLNQHNSSVLSLINDIWLDEKKMILYPQTQNREINESAKEKKPKHPHLGKSEKFLGRKRFVKTRSMLRKPRSLPRQLKHHNDFDIRKPPTCKPALKDANFDNNSNYNKEIKDKSDVDSDLDANSVLSPNRIADEIRNSGVVDIQRGKEGGINVVVDLLDSSDCSGRETIDINNIKNNCDNSFVRVSLMPGKDSPTTLVTVQPSLTTPITTAFSMNTGTTPTTVSTTSTTVNTITTVNSISTNTCGVGTSNTETNESSNVSNANSVQVKQEPEDQPESASNLRDRTWQVPHGPSAARFGPGHSSSNLLNAEAPIKEEVTEDSENASQSSVGCSVRPRILQPTLFCNNPNRAVLPISRVPLSPFSVPEEEVFNKLNSIVLLDEISDNESSLPAAKSFVNNHRCFTKDRNLIIKIPRLPSASASEGSTSTIIGTDSNPQIKQQSANDGQNSTPSTSTVSATDSSNSANQFDSNNTANPSDSSNMEITSDYCNVVNPSESSDMTNTFDSVNAASTSYSSKRGDASTGSQSGLTFNRAVLFKFRPKVDLSYKHLLRNTRRLFSTLKSRKDPYLVKLGKAKRSGETFGDEFADKPTLSTKRTENLFNMPIVYNTMLLRPCELENLRLIDRATSSEDHNSENSTDSPNVCASTSANSLMPVSNVEDSGTLPEVDSQQNYSLSGRGSVSPCIAIRPCSADGEESAAQDEPFISPNVSDFNTAVQETDTPYEMNHFAPERVTDTALHQEPVLERNENELDSVVKPVTEPVQGVYMPEDRFKSPNVSDSQEQERVSFISQENSANLGISHQTTPERIASYLCVCDENHSPRSDCAVTPSDRCSIVQQNINSDVEPEAQNVKFHRSVSKSKKLKLSSDKNQRTAAYKRSYTQMESDSNVENHSSGVGINSAEHLLDNCKTSERDCVQTSGSSQNTLDRMSTNDSGSVRRTENTDCQKECVNNASKRTRQESDTSSDESHVTLDISSVAHEEEVVSETKDDVVHAAKERDYVITTIPEEEPVTPSSTPQKHTTSSHDTPSTRHHVSVKLPSADCEKRVPIIKIKRIQPSVQNEPSNTGESGTESLFICESTKVKRVKSKRKHKDREHHSKHRSRTTSRDDSEADQEAATGTEHFEMVTSKTEYSEYTQQVDTNIVNGQSIPSTEQSIPSTEHSIPSTEVSTPSTAQSIPSTAQSIPSTELSIPPTELSIPSTELSIPPTGLSIPPTGLSIPPTGLSIPPTGLSIPSTGLSIPPTGLSIPPTGLSIPPTGLSIPSTGLSTPSTELNTPSTELSTPSTELRTPLTTRLSVVQDQWLLSIEEANESEQDGKPRSFEQSLKQSRSNTPSPEDNFESPVVPVPVSSGPVGDLGSDDVVAKLEPPHDPLDLNTTSEADEQGDIRYFYEGCNFLKNMANADNPVPGHMLRLSDTVVINDFEMSRAAADELHAATCEVDRRLSISQFRYRDSYSEYDVPPYPVPYPTYVECAANRGKPPKRCPCLQCTENLGVLLSNYRKLTNYRTARLNDVGYRHLQTETLIRRIEHSFIGNVGNYPPPEHSQWPVSSQEPAPLVAETASLPLKKRKTHLVPIGSDSSSANFQGEPSSGVDNSNMDWASQLPSPPIRIQLQTEDSHSSLHIQHQHLQHGHISSINYDMVEGNSSNSSSASASSHETLTESLRYGHEALPHQYGAVHQPIDPTLNLPIANPSNSAVAGANPCPVNTSISDTNMAVETLLNFAYNAKHQAAAEFKPNLLVSNSTTCVQTTSVHSPTVLGRTDCQTISTNSVNSQMTIERDPRIRRRNKTRPPR